MDKDARIAELEKAAVDQQKKIDTLIEQLENAEDEIFYFSNAFDGAESGEDLLEALMEMRRLVWRKQYDEAIDLADRILPSEMRYAT